MARDKKRWEDQSDTQRIEQLYADLQETRETLGNLIHDVGRLAARHTTAESKLKDVEKAVEEIERKLVKRK